MTSSRHLRAYVAEPRDAGLADHAVRALLQAAATGRMTARTVRHAYGVIPRQCPVCGFTGRFHAYGMPLRLDAMCPRCRSLERHRLLALWLAAERSRFAGTDMLHFAAEPYVARMLRAVCASYTTADAFDPAADVPFNIERIDAPDASYDYVLCSHVLEHVDDHLALAELYRVTRPGGTAILLVPIVEGWSDTFEDPGVVDPDDRVLLFGQHDHVRMYGRDFRDRVRNAGFALEEFAAVEPAVSKYALARGETIFIATRDPDRADR